MTDQTPLTNTSPQNNWGFQNNNPAINFESPAIDFAWFLQLWEPFKGFLRLHSLPLHRGAGLLLWFTGAAPELNFTCQGRKNRLRASDEGVIRDSHATHQTPETIIEITCPDMI